MRRTVFLSRLCVVLFALAGCATVGSSSGGGGLPTAPPQPTPMEAANRVIVRTTDAPAAAFNRAVAVVGRTFPVEAEDRAAGRLVTGWKEVEGRPMRVAVEVQAVPKTFESAEQTRLVLTAETRRMGQALPVRHEGEAKAVLRGHFGALDALARAYPRGRILYARQ